MSLAFPATAGAADPAPKPAEKPLTVNFVGDILLDDEVDTSIKKFGIDFPFSRASALLRKADITFGNLETSVSNRGKPASNKQFTFRSRPETLQSLVNAGFDGVSLANNHTLDYGIAALQDTISNLKKYKLGYTGAGNNQDDAFRPFIKNVHGKKVAIIGISRVLPEVSWYAGKNKAGIAQGYTMEPMMTYIKKAVKQSDHTIVYIHWSKERTDYPEAYARKYAKAFIDAGADAVIGSHSHSLHGIEWYKNKPIFYSLGNFVFASKAVKSQTSMIVNLTFAGGKVLPKVIPMKIVKTQPRPMDITYNKTTYAKLNKISYNAAVKPNGDVVKK
jgi:poly-gamma-glutamate synthesis protein (capsule biosynthesis protein)